MKQLNLWAHRSVAGARQEKLHSLQMSGLFYLSVVWVDCRVETCDIKRTAGYSALLGQLGQ
jgi:hypothetical protein